MSQDSKKIKNLIDFKKKLEKKIQELESEIKETQIMLDAVNTILLEKAFKKPKLPKQPIAKPEMLSPPEEVTSEPSTTLEEVIPLKSVSGELLANLNVSGNFLRVVMAKDKNFNVNTPPFTHFLIERVLTKMQEKDEELSKARKLTPDKIFSYKIVKEGDIIHEIQIRNVNEERLRELKSSIRWTLEKMHEKMKA